MKKFLTVLLVIAVMFTFSFGSAFAADPTNAEANLIKQAGEYVKAGLPEAVEKAYTAVVKGGTANTYITAAAWAAAAADIVDALEVKVDEATAGYLADTTTATGIDPNCFKYDYVYAATVLYSDYSYTALAQDFASGSDTNAIKAAREQFELDLAVDMAAFDKVDLDALYSKTTPTAANSYYKQAQDAIEAAKDAINYTFFDSHSVLSKASVYGSVGEWQTLASTMETRIAEGFAGDSYMEAFIGVTPVYWTDAPSVVKYYVLNTNTLETIEQEAAQGTLDAATTAGLKATIAQNVANYLTDASKTAPTGYTKQEWADLYSEVYGYIAEELPNVLAATSELTWGLHEFNVSEVEDFDAAITAVKSLEAYAAKVTAEKNAEGEVVRDAAAVAKLVKAAKLDKYTDTVGIDAYTGDTDAFDTVYTDIVGLAVSIDGAAAKLAFDKEALKADLADALDEIEAAETYYDLEFAAVKAAYEAAYAKIDAAAKAAEFDAIESALEKEVNKIKKATEVDALFSNVSAMDKELEKQAKALKAYVDYVNSPIAGKTYEDAYVLGAANVGAAEALLMDYYIENGARTAAEMQALTSAVTDVAATLPTVAGLEAAEKAAKAAVKALPIQAKVTVADKDAIVAAFNLIDAYEDLCELAGETPEAIDMTAAITGLTSAIINEAQLAYAKADKTDKAALNAINDAVEAYEAELVYDLGMIAEDTLVYPATTALANIQAAEAAAVRKAIAAIPFTVTEADKATVEAARAAYDAYVAEYTDYDLGEADGDAGFVADNFDVTALARAEAALGLNDNSEEIAKLEAIASVEGLKITAKSSAKKGAITVKWTVEGDDANVDYYEVRRSTKKNSGFGTKPYFKATKTSYKNTKGLEAGTRYYYKVRAVAEIDGEVYVSDWSNKAYRVAK